MVEILDEFLELWEANVDWLIMGKECCTSVEQPRVGEECVIKIQKAAGRKTNASFAGRDFHPSFCTSVSHPKLLLFSIIIISNFISTFNFLLCSSVS